MCVCVCIMYIRAKQIELSCNLMNWPRTICKGTENYMHPLKSDEIHVNWRSFPKQCETDKKYFFWPFGGMKTNERLDKWRWMEMGACERTNLSYSTLLIYYIHKMYHCSSKSLFVELNLANEIHIAGIFLATYALPFALLLTHTEFELSTFSFLFYDQLFVSLFCIQLKSACARQFCMRL